MPVGNGGIIGVANNPTSVVASGVWGLSVVSLAIKAGNWPSAGPFTVVQTFTASGTWTAPTGVTEVEYLVVAAGGGGGRGGGDRKSVV